MYTDSTDLISQIFKINIGVYLIFFGLWMVALNAQFWQANFTVYSIVMGVALTAACFMVLFELRNLRRFKIELTQGVFAKKKYFVIAPNIAGFTLLGVGAYVLSIFNTESLTSITGNILVFFWHPYVTEALVLILSGSAIVFLSMALYYRLLPDQDTAETTTQP